MAKVFYTLIVFSLNKFSSEHLTFIQTSAFVTLQYFELANTLEPLSVNCNKLKVHPKLKVHLHEIFWFLFFACIKAKRCLDNVFRGTLVFSISTSYQNFRHSTNTQ
jgi:hypothetical protein